MFVKFPGETKCEMIKSVDLRENNELERKIFIGAYDVRYLIEKNY